MSSSRNKRKRTDAEISAMVAAPNPAATRKRTALGDEPTAAGDVPTKDGEFINNNNSSSSTSNNNAAASPSTVAATLSNTNNSSSNSSLGIGESSGAAANVSAQPALDTQAASNAPSPIPATQAAPPNSTGESSQKEQQQQQQQENEAQKEALAGGAMPQTGNPASNDAATASNGQMAQQPQQSVEYIIKRENRIKSMITHRKLLLERTRSSRSAVRNRMQILARNDTRSGKVAHNTPNSSAAMEPPTGSNSASAAAAATTTVSKPLETAKDESEIAAFKRLGRMAVQAAKKQRVDGNDPSQPDKRTSVSLRRGASVGKKMNAALSSLAPGGAGAAVVEDGLPPTQPLHANTIRADTLPARSAQPVPTPAVAQNLIPPTTITSTTSAPIPKPVQHQSALPTIPPKPKAPTQVPVTIKQSTKVPVAPAAVNSIPKTARTSITQKSATAIPRADVARSTSVTQHSVPVKPLHAASTTPIGMPTIERKPVTFPQAAALRERRRAVLSQLKKYSQKRKLQQTTEDATRGQQQPPKTGPRTFESFFTNDIAPRSSDFPRRRRTHWDNILQEMQWMATDFIEERKWKTAAARTLGASIAQGKAEKGTKTASITVTKAVAPSPVSNGNDNESSTPKTASKPQVPAAASRPKSQETKNHSKDGPYSTPTDKDTISCKETAQNISSMADGLGVAILGACSRARRNQLGRPQTTEEDAADGGKEGSRTGTDGATSRNSESKTGSYSRINKAIEALLGKIKRRKTAASGKFENKGNRLALTPEQHEIIGFIEDKWAHRAGAIISGSRASGKTVAVCALLARRKRKGPLLIVCSSLRVLNWIHSLNRFTNLKVKRLDAFTGLPTGNFGMDFLLDTNDIVVCDYSAYEKLNGGEMDHFDSIVVDCRYPRAFSGSRLPSAPSASPSMTKTDQSSQSTGEPVGQLGKSFWDSLVTTSVKTSLHCVLVENPGAPATISGSINMTEMQRVELIALRMALSVGPHIFASSTASVLKRILTWARRKSRESADSANATIDKIKEVQTQLLDVTQAFCRESKSLLEQISWPQGGPVDSEIRLCELSSEERSAYEKCCVSLRGALSTDIAKCQQTEDTKRQILQAAAKAMLRLRRQCIHSGLSGLLKAKAMQARVGSFFCLKRENASSRRKAEDNPSQKDMELASLILDGSAKLRGLVSLLRNECGYEINGAEEVSSTPKPNSRNTSYSPSKVVVLAVLPEIQVLVSVLLSCIGVGHELLMSPYLNPCQAYGNTTIAPPGKQMIADTAAWLECQEVVSRFNCPPSSSKQLNINILVASPDIFAGDHGGIGVDVSDFIISVDDDWSGRNELLMRSLMASLVPRQKIFKKRHCRFLSLVCERTCEASFLKGSPKVTGTSRSDPESWPWGLDPLGRFLPDTPSSNVDWQSWPVRGEAEGIFAFPAQHVLDHCNRNLAEVLAVEGLPPHLNQGSSMFLPHSAGDRGIGSAEMGFLVQMMAAEETARKYFKTIAAVPANHEAVHVDEKATASIVNNDLLGNTAKPKEAVVAGSQEGVFEAAIDSPTSIPGHDNVERPESPQQKRSKTGDTQSVGSAACLLLYKSSLGPASSEADPLASSSANANQSVSYHPNRHANAVSMFHTSNLDDGREGAEALVYAPPVLPEMLQMSNQAQHDHEIDLGWFPKEPKRPAEGADETESKRFKGADSFSGNFDVGDAAAALDSDIHGPLNDIMDMDLDEDFGDVGDLGDVPLPNDEHIPTPAPIIVPDDSCEVTNFSLDSDRIVFQAGFAEFESPCDTEELEILRTSTEQPSLGAVMLVVAGKGRQPALPTTAPLHRLSSSHPETAWVGAATTATMFHDLNGSRDSVKAAKQKTGAQAYASALTKAPLDVPPYGMAQAPLNYQAASKAKDMHRNKVFSFLSGRQKSMGKSIFESPQYGLAAVRFKNRVNDRMVRQSTALESSMKTDDAPDAALLGNPATASTNWNVTEESKPSGTTEHSAEFLAGKQVAALSRSMRSPVAVDFGPFNSGFLRSSSAGVTGSWPPTVRDGVSLPMGVKVPQKPLQQRRLWTSDEDTKLKECVERFGTNWAMTAEALEGFASCRKDEYDPGEDATLDDKRFRRTSRDCSERWQELSHLDPRFGTSQKPSTQNLSGSPVAAAAAIQVATTKPQPSGDQRKRSPRAIGLLGPSTASELTLAKPDEAKADDEGDLDENIKKAFVTFSASEAKKQVVPVTIPGATPGSQPTFVASHPSHLDAVHSSIAATWTSGRTEMWPLQFLDVAEKQRTARAAAAAASTSASAPIRPTSQTVSPMASGSSVSSDARGPPPGPRTAARPHPMPAPHSAPYSYPHQPGQPYPHYPPPPRHGRAPYPPHVAPAPARSPPQRVDHPPPNASAPRGVVPPVPPPKPVAPTSSNHSDKTVPKPTPHEKVSPTNSKSKPTPATPSSSKNSDKVTKPPQPSQPPAK
ncbi:DNA binding protein [Seminavis robusta]|uniref:DNA binding protein n=1 Tax=Seminavis robusta TaxID=568900 RepID=A0A9N8EET2_9STRA|nr:DNA binding protein [Seminavis robusta]|eukprot:Sro971_g226470.1 DNA binding protein (2439) ;mRNA; f:16776-24166